MRRTFVLALAAAALGALSLVAGEACSSFSSDPAPEDAALADAASDGSATTDGADGDSGDGATDAGAADALVLEGCAGRYASGDAGIDGGELVFCDDFDGKGPLLDRWRAPFKSNGEVGTNSARSTSGGLSLKVQTTAPAGVSSLASLATPDLGAVALPFYVELDLYPETIPTFVPGAAYNGFVLGTYTSASEAQRLVYVGVSGMAAINPYLTQDGIVTLPIDTWYHVVMRFDHDATTLKVTSTANGTSRPSGPAVAPGPAKDVRLGIETGGGPTTLFIDDVFVHR